MNYVPLLIFAVVIVGLFAFSTRTRRRQAAAESERSSRIGVGSDVMTTSGLHGTVVAKNDDGTVALSIAPGVEVRWELAALRDVASLPDRYRRGVEPADPADPADPAADGAATGDPGPGIDLRKED